MTVRRVQSWDGAVPASRSSSLAAEADVNDDRNWRTASQRLRGALLLGFLRCFGRLHLADTAHASGGELPRGLRAREHG